ncbi:MAG: thioredoxin family protein [Nanoarchaeota archaeon]|nr:thioredoxin family protein [Nanoarchaeota archaeon]
MKTVKLEVFGPEPPCVRCQAVKKNAEEATKKLKQKGIDVILSKQKINSRQTVSKYGVLVSPALAINDVIRFMGRIPSPDEIEKEILKTI